MIKKKIESVKDGRLVPITEDEFDELVKEVIERYKLPNREHAEAVIANRICHLPPDQALVSLEYLGHCVIKNIAYQIAQNRGQKMNHKIQIDQLDSILTNNPLDQQALDALSKASEEGSEYAKEILNKYMKNEPSL
jgi:hypothetical protein